MMLADNRLIHLLAEIVLLASILSALSTIIVLLFGERFAFQLVECVCFRSRNMGVSVRRSTPAVGKSSVNRNPPESSNQDVYFHNIAPLSKSLSVPSAAGRKLQPSRTRWCTKHSFQCVLGSLYWCPCSVYYQHSYCIVFLSLSVFPSR